MARTRAAQQPATGCIVCSNRPGTKACTICTATVCDHCLERMLSTDCPQCRESGVPAFQHDLERARQLNEETVAGGEDSSNERPQQPPTGPTDGGQSPPHESSQQRRPETNRMDADPVARAPISGARRSRARDMIRETEANVRGAELFVAQATFVTRERAFELASESVRVRQRNIERRMQRLRSLQDSDDQSSDDEQSADADARADARAEAMAAEFRVMFAAADR